MEGEAVVLSTPKPEVVLACGSKSQTSTRQSCALSAAARLTQVVVFPTPPFWLTMAMVFPMRHLLLFSFSHAVWDISYIIMPRVW